MTKLTVVPPSTGEEDKNAEPKVGAAIKEIEKWANGEIDGTFNIKSEGVLEANLSKALQEKLTSKVGLTVEKKNESFTAETEKFYLEEKVGSTVTLPAPTLNRFIGVYAIATCKVTASAGTITGDFFEGGTAELKEKQKLVVIADGTNWRIFSGEPARERTFSNKGVSKAAMEVGIVINATRNALVVFYGPNKPKGLEIGGVVPGGAEELPKVIWVNAGEIVKATEKVEYTVYPL